MGGGDTEELLSEQIVYAHNIYIWIQQPFAELTVCVGYYHISSTFDRDRIDLDVELEAERSDATKWIGLWSLVGIIRISEISAPDHKEQFASYHAEAS